MSSTQPAPEDRHLPRGHLLVLNRSFRRTLEAENKSPGPSRPTPTPSGSYSVASADRGKQEELLITTLPSGSVPVNHRFRLLS